MRVDPGSIFGSATNLAPGFHLVHNDLSMHEILASVPEGYRDNCHQRKVNILCVVFGVSFSLSSTVIAQVSAQEVNSIRDEQLLSAIQYELNTWTKNNNFSVETVQFSGDWTASKF